MATQLTITNEIVDIIDDWNNPTLQLYIIMAVQFICSAIFF
jgi:hypothetical protein